MYKDKDVRKDAYFTATVMPSTGKNYNFVTKYSIREDIEDGAFLSDIIILRLAEQYLIRAEAYAQSNNEPAALADLNKIRMNRYTDYVEGVESGQTLKDAIALQRRLELAFEGHRWFDLNRKNLDVFRSANFGHLYNGGGVPTTNIYLPVSDIHRLWPIPHTERAINPNCEQNAGY